MCETTLEDVNAAILLLRDNDSEVENLNFSCNLHRKFMDLTSSTKYFVTPKYRNTFCKKQQIAFTTQGK